MHPGPLGRWLQHSATALHVPGIRIGCACGAAGLPRSQAWCAARAPY